MKNTRRWRERGAGAPTRRRPAAALGPRGMPSDQELDRMLGLVRAGAVTLCRACGAVTWHLQELPPRARGGGRAAGRGAPILS